MKRLAYVIITLFLLVCCSDKKTPKEGELKQYPWMEIFTYGRTDFIGIEHNLDLGTYSFSFTTSYSPINIFFNIVDSCAINDKWEIIQKTDRMRKYKRKSNIYTVAKRFDIVSLTYNSEDDRIIFNSSLNK